MKVRLLPQNPFSVGFGGVEIQASKYLQHTKNFGIDIDYFHRDEKDFDILHIVGIHNPLNSYCLNEWKKKGIKIIVSPVFYVKSGGIFDLRKPSFYKIASHIPFHMMKMMKSYVQAADILLPNSEDEYQNLYSIFGVKKIFEVIDNGVEENFFDLVDKNLFKKTYGLENYILCVGHIEPRKNHLNLLKAWQKIENKNQKLVLLGDFRGVEKSYHQQIKNILENDKTILHLNNLSSTQEIFRSAYLGCDFHILPSILETPGLSNLEASLAGKNIVVGDCKPVREYFGTLATYINPRLVESIKNGILNTKNNQNIELKNLMKQKYTWEKIGKQVFEIYEKIGK